MIGKAKKDIKAITKMAIKARTKPSQAKKLIDNGIDCKQVKQKISNNKNCIKARKDVTKFCFNNKQDGSHEGQESEKDSTTKNLEDLSESLGC